MKSIRFNTFETNSSSCHCVTICKKSLYEKLLKYELIYIGQFNYGSDYETYLNNIDEKSCISFDDFKEHLINICNSIIRNKNSYYISNAQDVLAHIDELNANILDNIFAPENEDWYEIIFNDSSDERFVTPDVIFDDEDATLFPIDSIEYELPNNDTLIIKKFEKSC